MAMNDTSGRASSVASSSEASLLDPAAIAKLLPKKDSAVGKVKIRKQPVKPKSKEGENHDTSVNGALRSPSPDSPLINEIDPELRATFPTGRPMEDRADMIQCKHCKKAMLTSVAASHIKLCLQKKLDRAQKKKEAKEAARKAREARDRGEDKDGDAHMEDSVTVGSRNNADGDTGNDSLNGSSQALKTGKKSTSSSKATPATSNSKKRKAEGGEADKGPNKKKTKKELQASQPKIPKPKGPVDVEKQCGVALSNGAFCARSLTCKSHSMGAKRAVPGRSLPYDMLLTAYQKKNQAKQQKAAIDANAPLLDETEPGGPIDSDEEKDAVMAAVARSWPRPVAQHVFLPVRKKYEYVRMKEMLSQALGGARGGGLFAGGVAVAGGGGGANGTEEAERRTSVAGGPARNGSSGAGPPSRKPSIGGPG